MPTRRSGATLAAAGGTLSSRRPHSTDDDGQTAIIIDGQEFPLEEFGKILSAHEGWGMRIAFVEVDELHRQPRIAVREPGQDE